MTDVVMGRVTPEQVRAVLDEVHDPEIPVLTISDLGILRDVEIVGDLVLVTVTPTYSGCPAMDTIRADIRRVLQERGLACEVRTVLAPAWTTEWMTAAGREKLQAYGIAPPRPTRSGPVDVPLGLRGIRCPQCTSPDVAELSRFGSTSCKSLWRCNTCREPFDHFRAH